MAFEILRAIGSSNCSWRDCMNGESEIFLSQNATCHSGTPADAEDAVVDILTYLRELATEGPIHYVANPGNAGDSMIAHATYQIFARLGIEVRPAALKGFDATDKIVVFGGGGSLIGDINQASEFVAANHPQARKFVILPHTSQGHVGMLASMGPNVELIARELSSYEHLRAHASAAKVMIADDLAFSIDIDELLTTGGGAIRWDFQLKRFARRHSMRLRESLRRRFCAVDAIHCFRTDREQTNQKRSRWNADISKLFKCGVSTPALAARSSWMIFDFLQHYREIRTNRLHLAIAAALLGKQVKFYPNSYFKCHAVYEYSMRGRFANVEWMG